jgi:hypothetical protein
MEALGLELCCKACGGTNVQHVGWFYPNRARLIKGYRYYRDGGGFGEFKDDPFHGRTYCADCDDHTALCAGPSNKPDDDTCDGCALEKKCAWHDPSMRGGCEG